MRASAMPAERGRAMLADHEAVYSIAVRQVAAQLEPPRRVGCRLRARRRIHACGQARGRTGMAVCVLGRLAGPPSEQDGWAPLTFLVM